MNIGELKELIKDLPDEMLVGNSGHFGEYLEVVSAYKSRVNLHYYPYTEDNKQIDIFLITTEDPGEEPD